MNKNKHKIITFAALMTVATIVIHFINRTIAAAAQLKQLLGITHSKYFEWRFGNIYYTKKGDGKPILLIHDTLPGASGYEWSEIEEKLVFSPFICPASIGPPLTNTVGILRRAAAIKSPGTFLSQFGTITRASNP